MEDIKKLWNNFKEKLDEDPQMKLLAMIAGVIVLALALFVLAKMIHSNTTAQPQQVTSSATAEITPTPQNTGLPAFNPVAAPAQAAQIPQPFAVATTPQEIVSPASKPLSDLSQMSPGYMMSWSYGVGNNVATLPELAKIEDLVINQSTFQFSSKPEAGLSNQIVPGGIILQSTATSYFAIENQQSPILNFLITSLANRRVQVFIDDQITPVVDRTTNGYAGDKESIPVVQPLAVGLHKITVNVWTNYFSKDTLAVVRVSIKRTNDSAPVDLQTFWPTQQAAATSTAQPAAVTAPSVVAADLSAQQIQNAGVKK